MVVKHPDNENVIVLIGGDGGWVDGSAGVCLCKDLLFLYTRYMHVFGLVSGGIAQESP